MDLHNLITDKQIKQIEIDEKDIIQFINELFKVNKDALASQPTVSRFFNRMDEDTLNQFLTLSLIHISMR